MEHASTGVPLGRKASARDPLRIAVLVSGRGSNMVAIAQACARGEIPVRIQGVVSDRERAPAVEKAKRMGLRADVVNFRSFPTKEAYHRALLEHLRQLDVEWLALAGYMRILPPEVIEAFPNRILNIHPSLLPAFPGLRPHEDALAHGVKVSGCTVHLVDEGVDSGPIVAQAAVEVRDDDTPETLAARVLEVEHVLYPRALGLVAGGRLWLDGRRVREGRR